MMRAKYLYLYSSHLLKNVGRKWFLESILPKMDGEHFFGLFETVLVYNGKAVFIKSHLDRMLKSCQFFNISLPSKDELLSLILEFLKKNLESKIAVLKVSVYGVKNDCTAILLSLKDYPYDFSDADKGIRITLAAPKRDPKSLSYKYKTTHRFEMDKLREEAILKGFHDVLFLNLKGNICETSKANIFAVFGNTIITPPQNEGLLKGVVRGYLLKNGLKGFTFKEAPLGLNDILKADEVFVTNSLIGALPVVQIDEHKFKSKKIANLIREFLWEKFDEENDF